MFKIGNRKEIVRYVSRDGRNARAASLWLGACATAPDRAAMYQSSAFGQLSGLFYLNIPKCVKHKEDHPIPIRRPGGLSSRAAGARGAGATDDTSP